MVEHYKLVELVGPSGLCKVAEKDVDRYLRQKGYRLAEPQPELKEEEVLEEEPKEAEPSWDEFSKDQIKAIAADNDLNVGGSVAKLIARLEDAGISPGDYTAEG